MCIIAFLSQFISVVAVWTTRPLTFCLPATIVSIFVAHTQKENQHEIRRKIAERQIDGDEAGEKCNPLRSLCRSNANFEFVSFYEHKIIGIWMIFFFSELINSWIMYIFISTDRARGGREDWICGFTEHFALTYIHHVVQECCSTLIFHSELNQAYIQIIQNLIITWLIIILYAFAFGFFSIQALVSDDLLVGIRVDVCFCNELKKIIVCRRDRS